MALHKADFLDGFRCGIQAFKDAMYEAEQVALRGVAPEFPKAPEGATSFAVGWKDGWAQAHARAYDGVLDLGYAIERGFASERFARCQQREKDGF